MFALLFLQASIASVLAGAAAWLLLRSAARTWPGLEARRTPWLLGAAAAALTLALGLLPASARPSIVPAIELPAVLSNAAADASSRAGDASADDALFDEHDAMPIEPAPALLWLGYSWLALYSAGLAVCAARRLQATRRLAGLLAASQPLDRLSLADHAGFASLQRALPEVREIDAPIAPMLVGLTRPVLLLPRHLRDFDPAQQRLVIEHELTHLARRDPMWMHASFLLQAAQWFNPMVSRLGRQMAWAQELGCDRTVLLGRPSAQRRAYAAALVAQMRMQTVPGHGTALAFGGRVVDAVGARINMIRDGVPAIPRAVACALGWAALPAVIAASVLLQPALAWHIDAGPAGDPALAAAALPHWQAPMQRLRVSAFFGVLHAPTGRTHGGIDFATPTGTPVFAPADGVVVASTNRYLGESKWGEVVAIEHANGLRSLYAHMDRRQVKEGDHVAAGQQIGTSGATGKATGPHLHMEVTRNGGNIDPQALLGNLEANATRTALQRLKASRAS
ncbi:peptidoglycan DD-metalloendopeptidase family protein [Pseudoduganella eburnea]|uniref:Peptidoglycan DD-metalloendopeptidase family protein n=1 Tax=Massilia eburnea TaxID=1776165 RepID=A0A6L6QJM9_9BURK|nr:M23/M56 family metallopeptidase [Massilia eburnea]MTW12320.1 peptidoglycan DD-metalloendopeptidase family protein [Massilia eburnea]